MSEHDTTELVAKLRATMGGVTPGPWEAEMGGKGGWIKGSTGEWCAMSCGGVDESANANARFIALCSPDNISALLDENKALREKLAAAEKALAEVPGAINAAFSAGVEEHSRGSGKRQERLLKLVYEVREAVDDALAAIRGGKYHD